MATRLIMPKLGLNMVEGVLSEWVKKEGDKVKKGETLYIVETDKVANEVEAPEDGVLLHILAKEGETVAVRGVVGVLAAEDEQVDLKKILEEVVLPQGATVPSTPQSPQPVDTTVDVSGVGQVLASPLVKRMAAEKGINLTIIKGSGPGGRIIVEDLDKALEISRPEEKRSELSGNTIPLSGIRKVVADRMATSAKSMAMVTLNMEINVTPLVEFRKRRKESGSDQAEIPSYNAMLVSLAAKALKQHPYLNASLIDEGIRLHEAVNIGVAVDVSDGLVVVVVPNANMKEIAQIDAEIKEKVERATNHRLLAEDIEGGTFTITNLGNLGVDSFNPIINPPESGILGIGRFKEKDDNQKSDHHAPFSAVFSLTFDHRIIDGAPAARFLQSLSLLISQFEG